MNELSIIFVFFLFFGSSLLQKYLKGKKIEEKEKIKLSTLIFIKLKPKYSFFKYFKKKLSLLH
jgi:hypothetical protein